MQDQIYKRLKAIYDKFSNSGKPVRRAYIESVHALINLAETRDPYTKRHSLKVSNYAVLLTKAMELPKRDIEAIRLAAMLHDIGKIGIREKVLLKPSALTKEEYEEVKKHPEIGAEIAQPLKFFHEVIMMIRHHHENYDGKGYPDGLKDADIPLGSRVLIIADVYDALTSKRAYRPAYPQKRALSIMRKESGKKFDPTLLKIFIHALNQRHKEKQRGRKEAQGQTKAKS